MTNAERAQALAEKHGATSYRNRADTSNPAFGFTLGQLQALIAEVEQAAQGVDTPWGDLKVAFDCDDTDALWGALDAGSPVFPKGWTLVETDGSAARDVAIFRVDHAPTTAEGSAVKAVIGAAIAAQTKQGEQE